MILRADRIPRRAGDDRLIYVFMNKDFFVCWILGSSPRMTEEKTQCCEDKGGRMCKDNYGGGYCITSGCCSEEMNRHLETYGEDIGACYECNEETHRWVQESGMRFCPAFSNGYLDAPNSNRCVTSSYCCWNNKPFSCTLDGHWCTCYAPYWKETNLNNGKQIGDLVHDGSVSTAPAVAEYAF